MRLGVQILWPPFIHVVVGRVEFYFGWRPTPPAAIGWGNEGLFPVVAHWLKRIGLGNLGAALRLNDTPGWREFPWLLWSE